MADPSSYGPETYGNRVADLYDDLYGDLFDIDGTLQLLAELAEPPARALELGIGTGRVAVPLARKGIEIHGIDASEAMVAKMRAKEGGDQIPVTIGDFGDVGVDGAFDLVFVVFNTLFALTSQEDQLRCFENVARRLADGGLFLIECFVPDLSRFDRNQRVSVANMSMERVVIDAAVHNAAEQTIFAKHLVVSDDGITTLPIQMRYSYPSELDLMARMAGLRRRDRWGGWRRQPFDSSSGIHVTVYEKA